MLFIVPCKDRIFPAHHSWSSLVKAMKNNQGGCLGCLNGPYGTAQHSRESFYLFDYSEEC